MVGDAAGPLYAAQAQYDQGLTSLLQMGVAVAGWRYANRGAAPPPDAMRNGWADNTQQQQAFAQFGLDSYDAGQLNIVIMPRPLLPPTQEDLTVARSARYVALKQATDAGLPIDGAMTDLGFTKDQIAATVLAQAERQARAQQIQENIQNSQQNGAQPQQQGANNGANNG
jgi:hypothetical protein